MLSQEPLELGHGLKLLGHAAGDDNLTNDRMVLLVDIPAESSTPLMRASLRIQLWSYNYAPEPAGIAPVSTTLAEGLRDRGHRVNVVAAHPHYPEPNWGSRRLPYRETRDGIPVVRLPIWIGRETTAARMRQELSFTAALSASLPFLGRPDVVLAASPSFPALLPAVAFARARRVPLVPWLHDVLPEGAIVTGHVEEGPVLKASRWLERTTYRAASRVVVLSAPFLDNLREKGVPEEKLSLIYDPATRQPATPPELPSVDGGQEARAICMGNIGHTQGLPPLVHAFDRSDAAREAGARLIITGTGVAAGETRAKIASDSVRMLGVVSDDELERELQSATLGVVTQQYDGTEFNLPSKIMNYMAYGLPIIAAVNPSSEAARLVGQSGSGWVADSSDPGAFPRTVVEALADRGELRRRGQAGLDFAKAHFSRQGFAERFEALLREAIERPI
jgi:colanic acid biosynthesis glycosyl transferase WcaI